MKKGLQDIIFLAPVAVKDRAVLGFSFTTQSSLVCFYGEKVTYFISQWEFDSVQNMWNVLYTEQEWKDAPSGKTHFENNTESFKDALTKVKELTCRVNCNNFTIVFQKALDTLSDSSDYTNTEHKLPLPEIPKENLHLLRLPVPQMFLVQWVLGTIVLPIWLMKKGRIKKRKIFRANC